MVAAALSVTDDQRQELQRIAASSVLPGPDHPVVSDRHYNLGHVFREQGDLARACVELEQAVRIIEVALGHMS